MLYGLAGIFGAGKADHLGTPSRGFSMAEEAEEGQREAGDSHMGGGTALA